MTQVWIDGELKPTETALSAQDRGLLLGEAVFETLLIKNGVPQFWDAHLERLQAAGTAFHMPLPYSPDALKQGVLDFLKNQTPTDRRVLRITLTGGSGGRGLVAQEASAPTCLMQISPAPKRPDGLRLWISDTVRLATPKPHKTNAYLDNIMARRQALAAGADEALLLNQHGRVASCAAGNLFVQIGKQWVTPPESEGALAGIMRAQLIQMGPAAGFDVVEGLLDPDLVSRADGLFVTNSVTEIVAASLSGDVSEAQKKQGHALCEALPQFSKF
tara:strand:- start:3649 stop:4470 length:822 start_codon:yes stop_codon:yes gene_type:complete